MPVTITNASAVIKQVERYRDKATARVAKAINDSAQEIHNESQRVVPVDTGNLRGSARIERASSDNLRATISYGGSAADYALAVHEAHPDGSKRKYLERPAREYATAFLEAVASEISEAGGG